MFFIFLSPFVVMLLLVYLLARAVGVFHFVALCAMAFLILIGFATAFLAPSPGPHLECGWLGCWDPERHVFIRHHWYGDEVVDPTKPNPDPYRD
jgi:hypothetical protein